jgi:hypothetical protein
MTQLVEACTRAWTVFLTISVVWKKSGMRADALLFEGARGKPIAVEPAYSQSGGRWILPLSGGKDLRGTCSRTSSPGSVPGAPRHFFSSVWTTI